MKIKPDVCAYVKTTPYSTDFVFRNKVSNRPNRPDGCYTWAWYVKQATKRKMRLPAFDLETGELLQKEENRLRAVRRARANFTDLALCNKFDYFGTITIDPEKWDVQRPDLIRKALASRFHIYEMSHPDFKYVYSPEYGEKTHRLHFHILCSGIETFVNEHGHTDCHLFRDYFGFCNLQKVGDSDADRLHSSLYCSKYITKQSCRIGGRYYFASHGLEKPDRVFLSGMLAVYAYEKLRAINAREVVHSKFLVFLACSFAIWQSIQEELEVRKEILDAHRQALFRKTPPHIWLYKPEPMTPEELSLIYDVPIQLSVV